MKLKYNFLFLSILALSIVFGTSTLQAQHKHRHPHPNANKKVRQHKKVHAKKAVHRGNAGAAIKVIKRTNHVITNAHKQQKKYKTYTGNLSRAVHHQRYAKKLLKSNKAYRAMQHSRLARTYAFKVLKSNKGSVSKAYQFNDAENKAMGESVADAELEKELIKNSKISFNDEAVSDKDMSDLEIIETSPSDYKNE